jgi:hypothetical protein
MEELEITWGRLFRIWWAAAWRSFVFASLFGGAAAGILAISLVVMGHAEWGRFPWIIDIVELAWIPAFLMGLRLAFRAKYRDFRIVLILLE